MRTTTILALADAFTARIRQITPTAVIHRDRRWREVDDLDQAQAGEIRCFYVDVVDVVPIIGGIYSPSAIEHAGTALVHTTYGNLSRRLARGLVDEDGQDVWLDLDVRRDATTEDTIAGLISVEYDGWQAEDDEQARYRGAHVLRVRLLKRGTPP